MEKVLLRLSQSVHRGLISREVKSAEKSYSVRGIHTLLLPESMFRCSVSQVTDRFLKGNKEEFLKSLWTTPREEM